MKNRLGSKLAYEVEKSVYREKKLRAKRGLGMGKEEFKRRLQRDLNHRKTDGK